MALGERTKDLAARYGTTQGRISQLRREFHDDWRRFTGEAPLTNPAHLARSSSRGPFAHLRNPTNETEDRADLPPPGAGGASRPRAAPTGLAGRAGRPAAWRPARQPAEAAAPF